QDKEGGNADSGGKGRGRKGRDPPATAEKLDSAMDSYWGNGKAAEAAPEGDEKENNDVAAMEGQDEEAPAADSAGGN
ncbi:unnamed protein product, partial [Ectocarpus sp. 12 AP-2014]